MITLSKHIEILLLDNDCVVVPDLGGFIAHYQSAYYNDSEGIYFPPQRIIGFNPKLTMNDGLLVQSYMNALKTDFSDANAIIENDVDSLKDRLYSEGSVEIPNIGTLSCNMDNILEFVPAERSIKSPNLYGLNLLSVSHYTKNAGNLKLKNKEYSLIPSDKKSYNTSYNIIGSAVGIAMAFILFFFLSTPVENTYVDNSNYAYLGNTGLFDAIKSESFASAVITNTTQQTLHNKKDVQKSVSDKINSEPKKNETPREVNLNPKISKPVAVKTERVLPRNEESSSKTAATVSNGKRYHIIISSVSTQKEAQRAVNEYNKKGYNNVSILDGKTRYRLSLCNFDNQADAYKKINELKKNQTFMDAWVFSSK